MFCSSRVLQLIHEAKWLTRLGIQIPEAAHHIMVQESRFKSYNDHLQLCITDFKEVCCLLKRGIYTTKQANFISPYTQFPLSSVSV